MSNVRAAPAWLTGSVVDRVTEDGDHVTAMCALMALGLPTEMVVDLERIAAVRNRTLAATACDLIGAAVHAIDIARKGAGN